MCLKKIIVLEPVVEFWYLDVFSKIVIRVVLKDSRVFCAFKFQSYMGLFIV